MVFLCDLFPSVSDAMCVENEQNNEEKMFLFSSLYYSYVKGDYYYSFLSLISFV